MSSSRPTRSTTWADSSDRLLMQVGQGVLQAWTHGIARRPGHWGFPTLGEQAEQFNHTNYFQGPFTIEDWRGGMNRWNPAWIIGLVLQAALRFEKMQMASSQ